MPNAIGQSSQTYYTRKRSYVADARGLIRGVTDPDDLADLIAAGVVAAGEPSRGLRLAAIGTSLVDNNTYVSTAGKLIGHSARGWLPWARFYSKGRILHPVWYDPTNYSGWDPSGAGQPRNHQGLNFGVAGQTGPQILARLPFIGQHYLSRFDGVIMDAGTNDMVSPGVKEDILATRLAIASWFLDRGKLVIMLPILGRGTAAWASGSAARKKAHWINRMSRDWAMSQPNCFWYDWNQAWVDGTSADGVPRTGFCTSDGTHFALPGGEAVGYDLGVNFLPTLYPPAFPRILSRDDVYDATDNPYGNLLTNGLFGGAGGTAGTGCTGSVADGWLCQRSNGTGTVAASKETRADGRGYNQVLTFTPSGAGSDELFILQASPDFTISGLSWLVGGGDVEVNAGEGISGITAYLRDTSTNGWIAHDFIPQPTSDSSGNVIWTAAARQGRLETTALHLQPGASQARFRFEVRLRGASGVAPVVKFSQAFVNPIDDPRPSSLRPSL